MDYCKAEVEKVHFSQLPLCLIVGRDESSMCGRSSWVGVGGVWGCGVTAGLGCGHSCFCGVWWNWAQVNAWSIPSLFGGTSWWLNVLSTCHSSSSSEWEGLFRTVFIVSIILLLATASKLCTASPTTELDFLTKFTGISSRNDTSLTNDSQEQCTGHCWLSAACCTH